MQTRFDPKLIVFFIILAITEIYMIGAFGSVEGSHGSLTRGYRDTARVLVLITALAGIFLLPSSRIGAFPIPRLPKSLTIILGLLMAWGLLSILNAKSDQRLFEFIYLPSKKIFWEWGPGTETSTTSRGFVAELAIMIAFVLMVAKSTQSSAWKGILASFVICGVVITFVGLGHKMLGLQHIYGLEKIGGRPTIELPEYYFAPFIYNANAASFLNLSFAIAVGLAFYNHRKNPHSSQFVIWLVCAGVCGLGVIAAASKAGVILLIFQAGLFALCEAGYIWRSFKKRKSKPNASTEKKIVFALVASLFLIFGITVVSTVVKRFDELIETSQSAKGSSTMEGRSIVRSLVWNVISDQKKVGWRGTGPGSFAHFFPFLITSKHSDAINQHWHYAHCDPLQTIAEWGYPGAALWFLIGIGALIRAITLSWTQKEGRNNAHIFKALAIGMIGISIHSTYDFPFSVFSIHVMVFAVLTIMWTLQGKISMRSSS